MKRFVSILLAALLVLCLTATAFAEDEGGKITVTKAVEGETYKAYKVLDLEYQTNDKGNVTAYLYKAEEAWKNFVAAQSTFFAVDDDGVVTVVGTPTADEVAALAKAALKYATDNSIAAAATATCATGANTVELAVGDLGYYVVDSSLGALCSLDTAMKEVNIEEKNGKPSVEKEEDKSSVSINQSVEYTVTVTIEKGAQNYVVKDSMSSGLTFNNDVSATCGTDELTAGTDFTVGSETGYTFIATISNDYVATLKAGDKIVFTYSATVNEDAVTIVENGVLVTYGDGNSVTCEPVKADLYGFKLLKKAETETGEALDGAEFRLYSAYDSTKSTKTEECLSGEISLIYDADAKAFRPVVAGETAAVITTTDGSAKIYGLAAGTYYLYETKAPDGFNRDKTVKTLEVGSGSNATATVTVVNKSGTELPSTGGMGTTIFYVVGGLCLVGAGVLLVTKKRTQE